jgi:hypothetical protein
MMLRGSFRLKIHGGPCHASPGHAPARETI